MPHSGRPSRRAARMAKIMAFYYGEIAVYEDADATRPIVAYVAYDMATGERAETRRAVHNEQSDEAFRRNMELWRQFQADINKPSLGRTLATTGWTGSDARFVAWGWDRGTHPVTLTYMGM
ncbi:MAG: hypothetical protein UX06_C0042G0004 [Candidatus Giovannonibacteria bacterium GW2011_GWA2_45_21]|uniref:Uncharacterized protein n=1 Tax=Candidatus Giovannonibacteria bacterium GW2011_GWA2_45_21 TaxID=1618649 RepID=A0A0G1PD54_9BACT|nr:MAG: hypothetical protein UX06_C0042G0004 [Candidatus Giovannonibacteria bacterium GW2011_GWA2_45_21]